MLKPKIVLAIKVKIDLVQNKEINLKVVLAIKEDLLINQKSIIGNID